jgi:RNA polymerase sigma-32 factor
MSKTTIALEAAVAAVIEQMPKADGLSSARQRANVDKAFVTILKLIAPRIRHFIRQYGLVSHWEDAEQCCAIAVHRAIMGYDPTKAQFTTFVNWQIRGELQSLRFRVMTDQRPSAKKVDATTVSLHTVTSNGDGEEATLESVIEDDGALARTEAGASDYLAHAATASLVEEFIDHQRAAAIEQLRKRARPKRIARSEPVDHGAAMLRRPRTHTICPIELERLEQKLGRDKEIVERRVFDAATLDELGVNTGVTKERVRQITKRASRTIAELASSHPRFAMMADYRKPYVPGSRSRTRAIAPATPAGAILPALGQPHNTLARVVAIDSSASSETRFSRTDEIDSALASGSMMTGSEQQDGNALGSQARH